MKYAVIPAFEPGETLIEIVRALKKYGFEVLVVDDGSGPRYAGIFEEAEKDAFVIAFASNHGKGHALKAAFDCLAGRARDGDTVVTLDCDGQHRIEDALRLCDAAAREPGTLFLGSRRQSGASPLRSRFGNAVTRAVFRLCAGIPVRDTQTGLRAFSARLLPQAARIPGERYEYEMNALFYCARRGIPVREIPVETLYFDNNAGSHFRPLRDSWRIYREILKFSASSLLGFLVDYALYSLLTVLGAPPLSSNVAARCVSAAVNFSVNRRFVFRDSGPVQKSAARYFALALVILACNSAILCGLTLALGVNPYLAKVLTELLLFVGSYLAQKHMVFAKFYDRECESL